MEKKEIIPGRRAVLEYLAALKSADGIELFIVKSSHGKIIEKIIENSRKIGIEPRFCEREELAKQLPATKHQGVLLIIKKDLKAPGSDKEFLRQVKEKNGILVLLDQVTDPHNAGSIIRSIEALGGDGVVIPKSHSAEINATVVKASAGATAHLKVLSISNVSNFLDTAKEIGYWIVGTSEQGDTPISRLSELKPSVIVIGSEGQGLRRLTRERCDCMVSIPMRGRIASLNASVATGIVLYEALKNKEQL